MKRFAPPLFAIAVALAAATAAPTPAAAAPDDRVAQPGPRQRPPADKREKVRQRIRAMRAMILAEELELDEGTAAKLAPILGRFDDELTRLLDERLRLRDELRAALDAGDDKRLGGLVDKLVANQDARWDSERKRFAEVRKLLTARQAARLLDVMPELDRRIMRGLRAPAAPRRPGRPLRAGPVERATPPAAGSGPATPDR